MSINSVVLQIYCVFLSVITLWLIGDKNKLGFIIGMASQAVWTVLFLDAGTYFLIGTSVIYFTMYLRGYLLWIKTEKKKEETW
jgi:nicotinamide riboside transporter PnuC